MLKYCDLFDLIRSIWSQNWDPTKARAAVAATMRVLAPVNLKDVLSLAFVHAPHPTVVAATSLPSLSLVSLVPVSYTHLTLPTICSV